MNKKDLLKLADEYHSRGELVPPWLFIAITGPRGIGDRELKIFLAFGYGSLILLVAILVVVKYF